MRTGKWWLAFGFAVLPVMAAAQPVNGVYVRVGLGADLPVSHDINATGLVGEPLTINLDAGFTGLASIGYGLGNGLRFEIEGSGRGNNIGSVDGTDVANIAGDGIQTYALMANVLYDFDFGWPWVSPYIGGGIGYAWTNLDNFNLRAADLRAFGMRASGTEGSFAYQAIVGASFPVDAVPGLAVTLEYRFMGIPGGEQFDGYKVNPAGKRTNSFLELGPQLHNAILVGLRYSFGGP